MGRLACGLNWSHEWSSKEKRLRGLSSGAQIGSGREGGGGDVVGVSVKGQGREQSDVEQCESEGKISLFLLAIHGYLTCLIKESPMPFCS